MGNGADLIKIYADYRWTPRADSQPTFLQEEIDAMVATANSAGKYVVAHAGTPEGMKRAILGGVETIEHGDGGTLEIFKMMKDKGIGLCPTLGAGDVGVFTHGENYREMELMVNYGMKPLAVLKSATSGNANMFHLNQLGKLKEGFLADIIAIEGNPVKDITSVKNVSFVMKDGVIYKE